MEARLAGGAPMTCQPTKAAWWSVRGMLAQECTSRRSSAPALACKINHAKLISGSDTSGHGYCNKSSAGPLLQLP